MSTDNTFVHLIAGGAGGTAGAVLTCPLEVVKTRLQSSVATFSEPSLPQGLQNARTAVYVPQRQSYSTCCTHGSSTCTVAKSSMRANPGLWGCLKYIVKHEGVRGLFKGLGPNLVGVAPSRAIYFCAYAQSKSVMNEMDTVFTPETWQVHMCSAACAGFSASTSTNPIWYIKTKLQLNQDSNSSLTVRRCMKETYQAHGIRGFYRGITASYYGIAETAIHFVIYEGIKAKLRERKRQRGLNEEHHGTMDFFEFMGAGAVSKTTATCLAYPHEVARTRLRQEGNVYKSFWQTLRLVFQEEGVHGLYRGLFTQLVRQIPNTAIMMATYEAVVYVCSRHLLDNGEETHDY